MINTQERGFPHEDASQHTIVQYHHTMHEKHTFRAYKARPRAWKERSGHVHDAWAA
ncbi:hypothetical protein F442_11139 [Phytophthora nicotianae P10297]|uniref:Uncharacterized protein n=2 Tax=Phytophthora nicotianae TaxID=4792 RepID=W2Q2V8_PHYN3|nr:hypothetical protein PPTG_23192 [Phytophthora nicotianae INRA-310]ETN07477.1 hypothetical protein PPTG_23192 [Phytophthora nicotianae INRA-310]ETP41894.1 hypothetical protein F442_11139 [Phytophthora nicotianae P10297]